MTLRLAWLSALLLASLITDTLADTIQDNQTWTRITATRGLGSVSPSLEKFRYWLEGQARFGGNTSELTQIIARPGLGYDLTEKASVWLGYAYVPNDPYSSNSVYEQRIWEQFLWTQPMGPTKFSFRNRLEQRFRPPGSGTASWRWRQMYNWTYPLSFAPGFSLEVSDEIFFNLNSNQWAQGGFDQNRAFVGVSYRFNPHVATEVGYMNRFIKENGSPNKVENILSLSLSLHY